MPVRKRREINIFSLSFLDVLSNSIGGLAFLLVMAVLMVNVVATAPPRIVTERLPDAYHDHPYEVWLSAREGLGLFSWSFGDGARPVGLTIDAATGRLGGTPRLEDGDGPERRFDFTVQCATEAEGGDTKPDTRTVELLVRRSRPVDTVPLRITSVSPLPGAYRDRPYPLVLAAEGGQPPYVWSATLPRGLRIDANGTLAGAPLEVGRFRVNVTVTAAGTQASANFDLEVAENYPPPPPLPPLTILTTRIPPAVALRDYIVTPAAQGGAPPYTWTLVESGQAWLAPSSARDAFVGRPAVHEVGRRSIVLEVRDVDGRSSRSEPMELEVLAPTGTVARELTIRTRVLPEGRAGDAYDVALAAEGGVSPYAWDAPAPPGLELEADGGRLTGTPATIGRTAVPVRVRDATGQQATTDLELRVRPALAPLRILTRDGPVARVGSRYELALAGTGGFPPYGWTMKTGTLPPGLVLDSDTGIVSGTPTEAGRWQAELAMEDAAHASPEETLSLAVEVLTAAAIQRLDLITRALPTLQRGTATALALAAEGGAAPLRWTVTGLPPGLALHGAEITGAPGRTGTFTVELTVEDDSGQRTATTLQLDVRRFAPFWLAVALATMLLLAILALVRTLRAVREARVRRPLRVLTDEVPNARASSDYAVQLACEGGEPPYVWRVVEGELPFGLELSPEGKLSGCPFKGITVDTTKNVPFVVEVTDGHGTSVRQGL